MLYRDWGMTRVIRRNANDFSHPIVAVMQNAHGLRVDSNSQNAVVELKAGGLEVVQALANPKREEISLSPEEFQFRR